MEAKITLIGETTKDDGWECRAWDVELTHNGRTMTTKFYTGMLHAKPTVDDVVGSLVSDAQGVEYDGFEDWADNYGMDTDSRKALAMYEGVVEQTERFKILCGDDFETIEHETIEAGF